jgi:hypothetical protein
MTSSTSPNQKVESLLTDTPEWTVSRALHEIHSRFILMRDTCLIAELPSDKCTTIRLRDDRKFVRVLGANLKIRVEVGKYKNGESKIEIVNAAQFWLDSENRREVEGMTYDPGLPLITRENKLNRWSGWGCEPMAGDTLPFDELIDYLVPDPTQQTWLLDSLAYPLQHPGAKMATATVLLGGQGVGKTTLGQTMRKVYGPDNTSIVKQQELESAYNSWAHSKQFLICEEITGNDNRKFADRLKDLITGPTITINEKFVPAIELPNRANLLFLTNHLDAFHIDADDRRLCILEIEAKPQSAAWYDRYYAWLDSGGASALFHKLLSRDLSKFNPHAHALITNAKKRMVEYSRSDVERWAYELAENPDAALMMLDRRPMTGSLFTTKQLLSAYTKGEPSPVKEKGIALALRKAGFRLVNNEHTMKISGSTPVRLWAVRDRDELIRKEPKVLAEMYAGQMGYTKPKTRLTRVK